MFARTAAIQSQVEEGEGSQENPSMSPEVFQSHSVDDLSRILDIDSQSGLENWEAEMEHGSPVRSPQRQNPLRRQRSVSNLSDAPATSPQGITPPSRKRLRPTKVTQAALSKAISQATDEVAWQREHGLPSKHERAIKILQECYSDKLSVEEMVKAVCLFEDRAKACVFIRLSPGVVRDAWIRGQIGN